MPLSELLIRGNPVPIVRWGDPVLHHPCQPVTDFGPELWDLLCEMFATNTAAEGAGLAALQIGVDRAVFVYDCDDSFGRRRQGVVCNPTILLGADRHDDVAFEGCLSYPGAAVELTRPDFAVCRGQDQFGEPVRVSGTGTLARCLQHETDHVNGIVMAEHLTRQQRHQLRREHRRAADRFPREWPANKPAGER